MIYILFMYALSIVYCWSLSRIHYRLEEELEEYPSKPTLPNVLITLVPFLNIMVGTVYLFDSIEKKLKKNNKNIAKKFFKL